METVIVPIPKSGKNTSNLQNYRSIALISCLCKILLSKSKVPYYRSLTNINSTALYLTKKITFIPRIEYSKNKSTRAQQLLLVVAHTDSGADRQTLIKLYRTLLCSQLDYVIFIYRSARRSYHKELDPVLNQSLILVLGTFRTSPIDSLYAEAHEALVQIRSEKLALQYSSKTQILSI